MIFVLALNIFTHSSLGFFLIAVAMAFSLCIQVSVPYMLLGIYREDPSYPKSRGLSSDNSIISSTFSVGQAAAILLSFIVQKTGTTTVIIPWSLGSAILALITAFYLDYGSNEASKANENKKQEDIQLTDNRNENL
ncbi:Oidioi.mRNA.OKI2018_I69.chr2.g4225.t1.cds [Oikopleura dioica]|uniref:Oidioi.mRNA.OKI2018_I69.chr2.g4225.t1.cds n=1 Tax=Oikopleura dioica TaxID=34765 RepID=A0ABN7SWM3_OIKDI|nr:Oidioi.mRNA.OKI2018_I69.chr2.g4225.t1.cds [Oikopleura dioica]